jgi:ATP-dependent 26S proteasome regulatory subunit
MTRELGKEAIFSSLGTRVRGEKVYMEKWVELVNDAFSQLKSKLEERIAFLLIDEADAIATTRSTSQMHQEAAVNTLFKD